MKQTRTSAQWRRASRSSDSKKRKAVKRRATTIYLDPHIAAAMKHKASVTGKSVSDLANESFARLIREDEKDLALIRERLREPTRDYEEFLKELRRDGLL